MLPHPRPWSTLAALAALAACGGASAPAPSATPAAGPAPWSAAPLRPTDVPDVYLQQWARAENRAGCALVAPAGVDPSSAVPRAAEFGGGWGVAYDLPDRRGEFGVAGAGVAAADPSYDEWPYRITWADGSTAGYGPEGGGAGPKQLAYLRIAGEDCLYNVWSSAGREHLERLLRSLRFVAMPR